MNTTEFTWFDYVSVCNSIAMVTVCVIGSIGNLLSLLIFLSPDFRRVSINLLLGALALADLLLLLLAIPVFSLAPVVDYLPQNHPFWHVYAFATVYLFAPAMMAQFMSIWLLVAVTLERWMAVCRPLAVSTYCTRQKTTIVIVAIVAISISFNFVRFWDHQFDAHGQPYNFLRADQTYLLVYVNICSFTFKCLLPLVMVLVFSILTIRGLFLSNKRRQEMTSDERSTQSITTMLLCICIVFSCCHSLYSALNVLEMVESGWFEQPAGYVVNDINNLLWLANGASSFIFYLICSTKYREGLWALVSCRAAKRSFPSTMSMRQSRRQCATDSMRLVERSTTPVNYDTF